MKKLILGGSIFLGLILVALIVVPMWVDVDQYRPKILEIANQRINGKLEMGRMQLSLWGKIRVALDGIQLTDARGQSILSVKDASVLVPWSSIFGGSPLLTLDLNRPTIRVSKDKNGKTNLLEIVKDSGTSPAQSGTAPGSAASSTEAGKEVALPALVTNARLGINIEDAQFEYRDELSKSSTSLNDFDLKVRDLSLSRTTEIEISGNFSAAAEQVMKIEGPFEVTVRATPRISSGAVEGMRAELDGDFDDLDISLSSMFHKKRGVKARVKGEFELGSNDFQLQQLVFQFLNVEIQGSGRATQLKTDPLLSFQFKSNAIDLAAWNEWVPLLKDYSLKGGASFGAKIEGLLSAMKYDADLSIQNLSARASILKAEPVLNANIKVLTDKVEKLSLSLRAPGNDLSLEGTVLSFSHPRIQFKAVSQSMDLDQLLQLPNSQAKSVSGNSGDRAGSPGSGGQSTASVDFDQMLDPLRKNEILRKTHLLGQINLKSFIYSGVKISDWNTQLSFKNLEFAVENSSMKVWDGLVGFKAKSSFLPKAPTYQFSTSVAGLDLQKAVASQFQLFKNTVVGKAHFKMDGSGSSFNPDSAKKNLQAKGSLRVNEAEFQSIDIGKMATESINKALEKVGDKIPAAKGKTIKSLPSGASKYEYIAGDLTIQGGKLVLPGFTGKARPQQGLDFKGYTEVGMLDQELKAEWELIDTYNLTKARDIGFEVSGVQIPSALAEGANPVTIPISVACKYTAPCPSYQKVPEHFIKVAFGNAKKGATQVVKEKAKEEAKDMGKKLLKGLFK